jgi:hypothetical protein
MQAPNTSLRMNLLQAFPSSVSEQSRHSSKRPPLQLRHCLPPGNRPRSRQGTQKCADAALCARRAAVAGCRARENADIAPPMPLARHVELSLPAAEGCIAARSATSPWRRLAICGAASECTCTPNPSVATAGVASSTPGDSISTRQSTRRSNPTSAPTARNHSTSDFPSPSTSSGTIKDNHPQQHTQPHPPLLR